MILELLTLLGISLILTIMFEVQTAYVLGVRDSKDLLLILLINLLTNPPVVIAYYLVYNYAPRYLTLTTIGLELLVILTEYHYLKNYGRRIKHPFILTASMNLFSFGVGKVLQIIL